MRAVLLILILVVVAALVAIGTGFLNVNQTRSAEVPNVTTTREGIAAKGGQTPAFEVQTGQVAVGSRDATIKLPAIEVRPANGGAAAQAPARRTPTTVPAAPGPAPVVKDDGTVDTNAVER